AAAARSKVQAQLLERQAAEAQLRALQAQIEPHFLFNTLATVVSLIDYDAPKAKAMLEAFIDYLRATLSGSRRGQATVGDELELVERYLQLLAIRMGPRLRVSITADATARAQPLPPLTLQPLVENAVQHGIEPLVGDGDIHISAQYDELGTLTLSVHDTGVGLGAAPPTRRGAGVALQNIRERLAAHYGTRAQLRLEAVQPHGTLATLTISAEAHA
ncbi:MAG: histidine kinase, partial [Betaproteobacteria bacterium]|nr:histidine kinase [Betaproteobacteria bacterium]